jgi:hypothetical protein
VGCTESEPWATAATIVPERVLLAVESTAGGGNAKSDARMVEARLLLGAWGLVRLVVVFVMIAGLSRDFERLIVEVEVAGLESE